MRSSLNRPIRSVMDPSATLSTESRFTADGRGMGSSPGSSTTSLARPRILVVHGATRALRSLGMAASRDRTTTGRRSSGGACTTRPLPALADRSRGGRRLSKGGQVAPLIGLIERMIVVGGVGGVDLGGTISRNQSAKGLIEKRSVVHTRLQASGLVQERLVDRGTDSYACHATTMSRHWPATTVLIAQRRGGKAGRPVTAPPPTLGPRSIAGPGGCGRWPRSPA
jgi:hypothetical protein